MARKRQAVVCTTAHLSNQFRIPQLYQLFRDLYLWRPITANHALHVCWALIWFFFSCSSWELADRLNGDSCIMLNCEGNACNLKLVVLYLSTPDLTELKFSWHVFMDFKTHMLYFSADCEYRYDYKLWLHAVIIFPLIIW